MNAELMLYLYVVLCSAALLYTAYQKRFRHHAPRRRLSSTLVAAVLIILLDALVITIGKEYIAKYEQQEHSRPHKSKMKQ